MPVITGDEIRVSSYFIHVTSNSLCRVDELSASNKHSNMALKAVEFNYDDVSNFGDVHFYKVSFGGYDEGLAFLSVRHRPARKIITEIETEVINIEFLNKVKAIVFFIRSPYVFSKVHENIPGKFEGVYLSLVIATARKLSITILADILLLLYVMARTTRSS